MFKKKNVEPVEVVIEETEKIVESPKSKKLKKTKNRKKVNNIIQSESPKKNKKLKETKKSKKANKKLKSTLKEAQIEEVNLEDGAELAVETPEPTSAEKIDFEDFDPELTEFFEDIKITDGPDSNVIEENHTDEKDEEPSKTGEKKNLDAFFSKEDKDVKKVKKKLKKEKKPKKRNKKKERDYQDIKDRKMFRYGKLKFTKVEDFIVYLNANYLELDEIAAEILHDENFLGWISKNSGVFPETYKKLEEIKQEIEK